MARLGPQQVSVPRGALRYSEEDAFWFLVDCDIKVVVKVSKQGMQACPWPGAPARNALGRGKQLFRCTLVNCLQATMHNCFACPKLQFSCRYCTKPVNVEGLLDSGTEGCAVTHSR